MEKDKDITKVIFRAYDNGDIIAMFPELPGDNHAWTCLVYEHIGQHGAADNFYLIVNTVPATPEQYTSLKAELESLGYNLQVCKRQTSKMYQNRIRALRGE